jgi:prepilin-type N-terminal cleavage/methylation domain-containing protein
MIRCNRNSTRFFESRRCGGGNAGLNSCRRMNPIRSQTGFTLLEVLVALAVLGIGVALTLSLISGSLRNIRKVQVSTRSIQHAETVLEMALLDDSIKKPTSLRGDFEDGTRWTVEIDEYLPPDSAPNATRLSDQLLGDRQQSALAVRLFSYTVDVMAPTSQAPDFTLQTLKLVNVTAPAGSGNIQGARP